MLRFDEFAVALGGRTLVRLDGTVAAGKVLAVMGPSGAGKSSLLKAVAGLIGPPFVVSGRVLVGEEDITRLPVEARGVGLMFQDALLFPHMSVVGNVMFAVPRRVARSRGARREVAMGHLGRVAMAHLAEADPATLSGGERSRVALARTLAGAPRVLLLDEPFAALDQALKARTRDIVFRLAAEDGLPVVMVSHDPADAEAARAQVVEIRPCQEGEGS
ncbi:ATP-binding cassette domain-containing protein [Acuticoccus mangrovi]|uniref:ATP-binding cassette domain-containing protein n=1 Tax=Acuticoccus mangrovi TaxID=2796142 RepID=A0A934IK51_9HYPH|nr:ATP-binding cassette domain-containing protein [Acuticoccus mangrovi]MBJ3775262.1 ATP-binding cassette domain-containing protein [Acuticoccus mangrovi]